MFEGIDTAQVISLSLTPIFLIIGIGQIMNSVTGRLARIIDRGRWYEELVHEGEELSAYQKNELDSIKRRLFWSNWSVNLLTLAALLICVNTITLLLQGITPALVAEISMATFILGLVSITGGLLCFLIEVSIATRSLRLTV